MSFETDIKPNTDGINLLVSILICYSEIEMLNFEPRDGSLRITYMLDKPPKADEFAALRKLLQDSMEAYCQLERREKSVTDVALEVCEGIAFIKITRDVASLSKGEIVLINTLIQERFADTLISDRALTGIDEDIVQEDMIDSMIGSVKSGHVPQKLVGIRDNGRVMVYNK